MAPALFYCLIHVRNCVSIRQYYTRNRPPHYCFSFSKLWSYFSILTLMYLFSLKTLNNNMRRFYFYTCRRTAGDVFCFSFFSSFLLFHYVIASPNSRNDLSIESLLITQIRRSLFPHLLSILFTHKTNCTPKLITNYEREKGNKITFDA